MFSRGITLGIPDVEASPQDGYVATWSLNAGRALWKPITGALLSGFAAGLLAFGAAGGAAGTGLTTAAGLSFNGGSNALSIPGALAAAGIITNADVTDSSTTASGSIQTLGGIGVAKAITVGTTLRTIGRGGISTSAVSAIALLSVGEGAFNDLTGTNQQGGRFDITGTSAATAFICSFVCQTRTTAAAYTCALAGGGYLAFAQLGAGSAVTRCFGAIVERPTVGTNNAGLNIIDAGSSSAWIGNFAIASETTQPSLFAGGLTSKNATAGIGYSTGAGGTVTQATSKSTTVVLNAVCGTITLNGAALASATSVAFTLTDSAIAATDVVVCVHDSVGTLGGYGVTVTPAAGSATVTVRNNTAGSLSEAIVLRFAVVKAVTA